MPRPKLSRRDWLALAGAGSAAAALPAWSRAPTVDGFRSEWRFGQVRVTKVLDVVEPFDAARAYPGAPLDAFARHADWLPPYFYDAQRQAVMLSFHSYLLRTGRLTILVDTCWGEDTPQRTRAHNGRWLANLAAAGAQPEQIDIVTCTHFHADHIGWNTRLRDGRWVPSFPNARHLFNRTEIAELEASVQAGRTPAALYEQSIRPVLDAGLVLRLDGEHEVAPGIRIVPSPGHSPGHQHIEIVSRGSRAVISGDILHSPIEVRHPEWVKLFDQDKQAAIAQRTRFIDACTDAPVTVLAAHFGGPTAGRIVSSPEGRRFRTDLRL